MQKIITILFVATLVEAKGRGSSGSNSYSSSGSSYSYKPNYSSSYQNNGYSGGSSAGSGIVGGVVAGAVTGAVVGSVMSDYHSGYSYVDANYGETVYVEEQGYGWIIWLMLGIGGLLCCGCCIFSALH